MSYIINWKYRVLECVLCMYIERVSFLLSKCTKYREKDCVCHAQPGDLLTIERQPGQSVCT